ncbi:MAG: hypothetical protein HQL06_00745 [Nitrospirae bacterium]|nr:hypothetical protein [Nitrospirota bacterium]
MEILEERVDKLESIVAQTTIELRSVIHDLATCIMETNLRIEETNREFKESDNTLRQEMREVIDLMNKMVTQLSDSLSEKIAETNRELSENMVETNREFNEKIAETHRELSASIKEINKDRGYEASKRGTIVEDILAPGVKSLIRQYFKCEPDDVRPRTEKRMGGENFEVDLLLICEDKAFMIEVKAKPKAEDIDHILKKAERFTSFFPECADKEIIHFLGSIVIGRDIVNRANKKGLYAVAYREWEYLDILNFTEVNRKKGQQA